VLTVSDGVVAGTRQDASGAGLISALCDRGFEVVDHRAIPDGVDGVAGALREMAQAFSGVIVTTGGTGFGPRDLTPEGTLLVLEREAPGLAEAVRAVNPLGRLSRGRAGIIGTAVVVNLPGSRSGALEGLAAIADVLTHAIGLANGEILH
jgi:molybdenum cofactor synthesis domain-containing protein